MIFLVVGLGLLADAVMFMQEAERTRGEVVDIHVNSRGDGASYTPTIRYRRSDGQTFEAETHISSSGYSYRIGDRVKILYSRDTPDKVRIDSFFSLYGPGLILSAVGAGFFLIVGTFRRRSKATTAPAQRARSSGTLEEKDPWRAGKTEPRTTDPSQPGHVHEPKPKHQPTVRRMR